MFTYCLPNISRLSITLVDIVRASFFTISRSQAFHSAKNPVHPACQDLRQSSSQQPSSRQAKFSASPEFPANQIFGQPSFQPTMFPASQVTCQQTSWQAKFPASPQVPSQPSTQPDKFPASPEFPANQVFGQSSSQPAMIPTNQVLSPKRFQPAKFSHSQAFSANQVHAAKTSIKPADENFL